MKVEIKELTPTRLIYQAMAFTTHDPKKLPKADLRKLYLSEHSPIRVRDFWIELYEIPTATAYQLRTHKNGVEHYIESFRTDRGGPPRDEATLASPRNHAMKINAQALINMARARLCQKAEKETRKVMEAIKDAMKKIDPDLAKCMLPNCEYRGRCCELKKCGKVLHDVY
jgi:thymidylate synthase ThyX